MRAVVADMSPQRYVITAAAQRLPAGRGRSTGWGPLGILRFADDHPSPVLPGPGWVRLRPELSGICGSDVGVAHAKMSLVLSAFYKASSQIVGHEIVGVVDEVGAGVTTVREGDRVVVDPVVACRQRGFDPPCRACGQGRPDLCERFDEPGASGCAAPLIGFDAVLGGGWAEQVVAHESQLYRVGGVASRRAVLAEPASVALHAALRWERRGDRIVVIGPGTIGLLVTAALRMRHPDVDIIMLSPNTFGADRALAAGATRVLRSGPSAVEELAALDGGRVLRPRMTKTPILQHGVDAVFDCVGYAQTIDLGIHLLRSSGTLVLVGGAGKQEMDWSLVWHRGLTIAGTVFYGPEEGLGGATSFAQVVEWLGDKEFRVDGLVTHEYPLQDWRTALEVASAGPAAGCVKAVLRPNPGIPLHG